MTSLLGTNLKLLTTDNESACHNKATQILQAVTAHANEVNESSIKQLQTFVNNVTQKSQEKIQHAEKVAVKMLNETNEHVIIKMNEIDKMDANAQDRLEVAAHKEKLATDTYDRLHAFIDGEFKKDVNDMQTLIVTNIKEQVKISYNHLVQQVDQYVESANSMIRALQQQQRGGVNTRAQKAAKAAKATVANVIGANVPTKRKSNVIQSVMNNRVVQSVMNNRVSNNVRLIQPVPVKVNIDMADFINGFQSYVNMKTEIKDCEASVENAQVVVDQLKEALQKCRDELTQFKKLAEVNANHRRVCETQLTANNSTMLQTNNTLSIQLEEERGNNAKLKAHVTALASELKQTNNLLKNAAASFDAKKKEHDDELTKVKKKLTDAETRESKLNEQLETAKQATTTAKEELTKEREKMVVVKEELANVNKELLKEQDRIVALKENLNEVVAAMNKYKQDLHGTKAELMMMEESLMKSKQEMAHIHPQVAHYKQLYEKVSKELKQCEMLHGFMHKHGRKREPNQDDKYEHQSKHTHRIHVK